MINTSLPKIVRDNCLDVELPSDKKIWALDVPVSVMHISKLDWQFDIPFWKHKNKKYAITPNQVLANKHKYSYQYRRILNADTNYLIDILRNQYGKWEVLDGLHRLVKLNLLGVDKIRVRKISLSKLRSIL